MKITAEQELETMPFDRVFEVAAGRWELCHATGKEVQFQELPGDWWNEYIDRNGDYWYGR